MKINNMNAFLSWIKGILFSLIASTILVFISKKLLNNNISIFRIVLIYIVMFILDTILWQIKRKEIKFTLIKFTIFMGVLGWGVFFAIIMTLILNNPFEIKMAIRTFVLSLVGGFLWGILTYTLTKITMKIIVKKKKQKDKEENNQENNETVI